MDLRNPAHSGSDRISADDVSVASVNIVAIPTPDG
jgi:hypothetical protein